ncbi:MAG: hypothetical protein HRU12_03335, partial [Phaeodactylibacter sp.]|nr:hypothetical protein [Phaeodactylibacter sp.]
MPKATEQILSRLCHRLFFSLSLTLLVSNAGISQSNDTVDSLTLLLKNLSSEHHKGDLYNKLSHAYSVFRPDSSYQYALLAEQEGLAQKDTSVLARAYILQGTAAADAGNLAEAIRKTELGLLMAKAINDSANIANAYNNLALADMDAGDAKKALSRFQKSLDYTTTDTLGRVYTLNNIALLYSNTGNKVASNKYMQQALDEARQSDDPLVIMEAYFTDGMIKMADSTRLDSALFCFRRALDISRDYKDLTTEVHILINIGIIHRDMKRLEVSERSLFQAIIVSEESGYEMGKFYAILELAELHLDTKSYSKAKDILNQIPLENTLGLNDKLLFHELLTRYFRAIKQFEQALSEQDSVLFYKDSLSNAQRQQELTRLEVNYEVQQKNRANKILALEKERAEQQVINQQRLGGLALILLLLLLATAVYLLRQRRRFNQMLKQKVDLQTKELLETNKELQHTNQELERFTYIASHDLKEPLRNIISFTNLLERKKALWEDHEDAKDFFGHIKRSARQMYTLIQDVLAYAQIREGQGATQLMKVNLGDIMAQI